MLTSVFGEPALPPGTWQDAVVCVKVCGKTAGGSFPSRGENVTG